MEIVSIQPFLQYLGNVRERTMCVARSIPAHKINWTYAPEKFTLGDILRHLAVAERYMWAENVQGRPARYTTHGKELADGLENVLAFMERLHVESVEIFSKLSTEDLQRKCVTPGERSHHYLEVAAFDDRTRNSSPRTDLFVSGHAGSSDPAAIWTHV